MTASIRTAGNARPYEYRPSDHRAGMREHWHGRLQPMEEPRRSWWSKFYERKKP